MILDSDIFGCSVGFRLYGAQHMPRPTVSSHMLPYAIILPLTSQPEFIPSNQLTFELG